MLSTTARWHSRTNVGATPASAAIATLADIAGNSFAVRCGFTRSTIPARIGFAAWRTKRGNRIRLADHVTRAGDPLVESTVAAVSASRRQPNERCS